ncbi:hypothetical protein ABZ568_10550 [Streptomyces olindensis]|uniref:Uncharacterized protein n=1 Tax=Streptomyces olindensis TaxID=358823 RepID=A0ABV2XS67_9ACTN
MTYKFNKFLKTGKTDVTPVTKDSYVVYAGTCQPLSVPEDACSSLRDSWPSSWPLSAPHTRTRGSAARTVKRRRPTPAKTTLFP